MSYFPILIPLPFFKGKNSLSKGIFDDKWVVIPIIEDAIKALKIISSLTQRTLAFSSVHTKKSHAKKLGFDSKVVHGINVVLLTIEYLVRKKILNLNNIYSIKIIFFLAILEKDNLLIKTKKKKKK